MDSLQSGLESVKETLWETGNWIYNKLPAIRSEQTEAAEKAEESSAEKEDSSPELSTATPSSLTETTNLQKEAQKAIQKLGELLTEAEQPLSKLPHSEEKVKDLVQAAQTGKLDPFLKQEEDEKSSFLKTLSEVSTEEKENAQFNPEDYHNAEQAKQLWDYLAHEESLLKASEYVKEASQKATDQKEIPNSLEKGRHLLQEAEKACKAADTFVDSVRLAEPDRPGSSSAVTVTIAAPSKNVIYGVILKMLELAEVNEKTVRIQSEKLTANLPKMNDLLALQKFILNAGRNAEGRDKFLCSEGDEGFALFKKCIEEHGVKWDPNAQGEYGWSSREEREQLQKAIELVSESARTFHHREEMHLNFIAQQSNQYLLATHQMIQMVARTLQTILSNMVR